MLYYLQGAREEDAYLTESDIVRIAQQTFRNMQRSLIPDPPSHIFEWDEERDMIDMTGLTDIPLTS